MKIPYKYLKFAPLAIFITVWAILWAVYSAIYQHHFFWQEQNQIFLQTSDWCATYFGKPAWLACMAGEYLTQFYYYVYAGPAILSLAVVWCASTLYCIMRRIANLWVSLAVMTAGLVLLVFCTFSSTCTLPTVFCILGGLLLAQAGQQLRWVGVIMIPLSWWMFGFGAVITAALMIASALKWGVKSLVMTTILSLALLFATPAVLSADYSLKYKAALLYPGVPSPESPNMQAEQRYEVENLYYFGDLDGAAQKALEVDTPNVVTAFYYYMSKARKDSLPDCLLEYPLKDLGTLTQIGETTPLPVINMMNDLYYELGDMMYAERAAMMRNVFSPHNRNARMIKRLAEINLVSGDTLAAKKHLGLLANTAVYRKWAKAHNPDNMDENTKADIMRRRGLINKTDTIRIGDNCRTILIELLESNPDNTAALDYLLCTALLLGEMDTFKADYDRFCMQTGKPRPKNLYQQALMIYLAGTNAPDEEWSKYILNRAEFERFKQYSMRRGDPAFKDTYWYYFDKTHQKK